MRDAICFENARGFRLAGTVARPDRIDKPAVVLLVHDRGSSKGSPRNVRTAEALLQAGLAYMLFDLTGHGDSEGDPASAAHEDFVGDVAAAVDFAYHSGGLGAVGVCGAGAGAAAALAHASEDPRVQCLALRAPGPDVHAVDASAIGAPTLVVQGILDPRETRERNLRIAGALPCEHKLLTVNGTGPRFPENGSFDVVLRETVEWLRRHLS